MKIKKIIGLLLLLIISSFVALADPNDPLEIGNLTTTTVFIGGAEGIGNFSGNLFTKKSYLCDSCIQDTSINVPSLNFLIILDFLNLTSAPTHLSNFTDNLGDRGFTHLSNFTDDVTAIASVNKSNFWDNLDSPADISILGTITVGVWQGTSIADAFIASLNASKLFNLPSLADSHTHEFNNITNEPWIEDSQESSLNVNRSDFWDSLNNTVDITSVGVLSAGTWQADSIQDAFLDSLNAGKLTNRTSLQDSHLHDFSNVTNEPWIEDSQEGDLNVNSSNFWDSLNLPTDITSLGTITVGVWQATPIVDAFISFFDAAKLTNLSFLDSTHLHDADNVTNNPWIEDSQEGSLNVNSSVFWADISTPNDITVFVNRSDWTSHDDYPIACPGGQFVTAVDDVLSCDTPAVSADTDSNASTECDANEVLLGNTSCLAITAFTVTVFDSNASTECSVGEVLLGNGTCLNVNVFEQTFFDSNATTECVGDQTYLDGEGGCDTLSSLSVFADDVGYMTQVLNDTSPQLGGDLDSNNFNITMLSTNKICLNGVTCTSFIFFNGTHTVIQ